MVTSAGDAPGGWRYLWAKYVRGFQPGKHCAVCLVGPYSKVVGSQMVTNLAHSLDAEAAAQRFDFLYLCGVASQGSPHRNLHMPVVPSPGSVAEIRAATGDTFIIHGARLLDIAPIEDGAYGRGKAFTRCRNWQFGVERYGPPPTPPASDEPG